MDLGPDIYKIVSTNVCPFLAYQFLRGSAFFVGQSWWLWRANMERANYKYNIAAPDSVNSGHILKLVIYTRAVLGWQ